VSVENDDRAPTRDRGPMWFLAVIVLLIVGVIALEVLR
jgi:hypothetical protein